MRPKNLEKEDAIRNMAMQIIAEEGLENLSMQKLAKAANISPRTIYIKYDNKEDFILKLFISEVLGPYETAVLEGFDVNMGFAEGVKKLWQKTFKYFRNNRPAFVLMQHSKISPLLNKAFSDADIRQDQYFAPIHKFLKRNVEKGIIRNLPFEVQRALLLSPAMDLLNEYFDHIARPKQIITEKIMMAACEAATKGLLK